VSWPAQVSRHCPDNPLLGVCEQHHPLHQPAQWVHGPTMFNQEQRAQWERERLAETIGVR
jgi:hypothetical protein